MHMQMYAATHFGYWALQQGLAHHHSRRPMECADKPFGRRRRRRRRRLGVRTARALAWLVLALRCINHHSIRCLHGRRPRLEDLRQGGQPQLRLARGSGLGALQFWAAKGELG